MLERILLWNALCIKTALISPNLTILCLFIGSHSQHTYVHKCSSLYQSIHTGPGPVGSLMASISYTSDSFRLSISWIEPSEPNGLILSYDYTVSETEGDSTVIESGSTTETSITDEALSGVEAFTNYTVSVLARNSAGAGQESTITLLSPETSEFYKDSLSVF